MCCPVNVSLSSPPAVLQGSSEGLGPYRFSVQRKVLLASSGFPCGFPFVPPSPHPAPRLASVLLGTGLSFSGVLGLVPAAAHQALRSPRGQRCVPPFAPLGLTHGCVHEMGGARSVGQPHPSLSPPGSVEIAHDPQDLPSLSLNFPIVKWEDNRVRLEGQCR